MIWYVDMKYNESLTLKPELLQIRIKTFLHIL